MESDARTVPTINVKAADGTALTSNTICNGGSVLLSNTTNYGTQLDYRWEVFSGATAPNKSAFPNGTAVFNSTQVSPIIGPFNTAGTYTVRYQVRELCCGWSIPAFATIAVYPDPTAPTNIVFVSPSSGSQICEGQTITVSASSGGTGGISPYTYEYLYDDGSGYTSSYGSAPSFTASLGDNGVKVRIKANDSKGCDASSDYEEIVTGNQIPDGVANPSSQEICSGQVADISFTTSNGVSGTTFTWTRNNNVNVTGLSSGGSGPISSALSLAAGVTTAQTVTFTVTPSGPIPTLCTGSTFTASVVVNPNPTVSPSNNGPMCEGATLTLSGGGAAGTAPYTYAWTGPSAYTASGSPVNRTLSTAAMSGTYSVTLTDNKGCTASGSTVATVVIDPSITGQPAATTICAGTSYTTSVTVANGTALSYQWQYSTDGSNWNNVAANLPATGMSYLGATTAAFTVNTTLATPLSDQYRYRCLIGSGTGCNPSPLTSDVIVLNVVPGVINPGYRTWTGMVSTSWLNTLNWDCGGVPTLSTDVIIPVSTTSGRYPVITNGQVANCRTLEVYGPPSEVETQDGSVLNVALP